MQGRVFSFVRPGQHGDLSHPNAVILQTGRDSFLCVVGMTPGKHNYEIARQAEFVIGVNADGYSVLIDHRVHLKPIKPGLTLQVCGYVCYSAEVKTSSQLMAGTEWGTLSPDAVKEIVRGVLLREEQKAFLPKRTAKLLKKWLDENDPAPPLTSST